MYKIAKLKPEDRKDLFIASANKMNIAEAIVEKDFWVCFMLDYIFHDNKWKKAFAFKGGTSLSKAYNLIERFSEDIDLILDWRTLGYSINEPWENRSNTKQQKFIEDERARERQFITQEFIPVLKEDLRQRINDNFSICVGGSDMCIVKFMYPRAFSDRSILNEIQLEIGAMAAWTPTQWVTIQPYTSKLYPEIFEKKETKIFTTMAERTFWEKATILHQEAYRPKESILPMRYSRHYYDMYCLSKSDVKNKALNNRKLLENVVAFKEKFYPRNWARYDLAKIGQVKLLPPKHSVEVLKNDYQSMQSMIYGKYPQFEEIMTELKNLEEEIKNVTEKENKRK